MHRSILKKASFVLLAFMFPPLLFLFNYESIVNEYIFFLTTMLFYIFLFTFSIKPLNNIFSVFNLFSVMYFGYVIGGFYYSFQKTNFGKFIGFINISTTETIHLFEMALLVISLGYVFFIFGCFFVKSKVKKYKPLPIIPMDVKFVNEKLYLTRGFVIVPLLVFGMLSWYQVAVATSGGILESIIYFQAFRHMAESAGVSTLFYNFYYAGIYYWLYLTLSDDSRKISIVFIVCSMMGMVMNLTQGQIMAPITFILSQVIAVALFRPRLQKKMLVVVFALMGVALLLYFLRIVSNYIFMGQEMQFQDAIGDFMYKIIGSGNTADIQQIAIILNKFEPSSVLLGSTYIDWLRNSLGGFFGIEPSSVGLTLKKLYFPSTSGAPTPGALGELIANFYFLGPFMMFFVGVFLTLFQTYFNTPFASFYKFISSIVLAKFIFLYAKVDSTMLSSLVFLVLPLLAVALIHTLIVYKIKFKQINT